MYRAEFFSFVAGATLFVLSLMTFSLEACTSWMLFPDVTGGNLVILHKNRDSQSRDVAVRKGFDKNGRVWLGMGGKKGFAMAVNSSGLAGVMNGGEKCTDNSKNPDGKHTPVLLEEIISTCDTAEQAVKMLEDFLKKGDYNHGESGSIFFFADTKEGYLAEFTANFFVAQKCSTGYVARANIWHHPGLAKYATTDYHTYAIESTREYVVREAINNTLAARGKVDVKDILDLSRKTDTPHPIIRRSVCCSWTNSASTFAIDREYPDVLTTAYLLVGAARHTVQLPFPICIDEIPEEFASGKVSAASYKRLNELKHTAEIPAEWLAFEKSASDEYAKSLAQAKELMKSGKKSEAVKVLNASFKNIWQKAKALPGLLK